MNLYFTVFTLYTPCVSIVYSRVLGYFWLSRLKPKKQNKKKQISNLKNHCFFHPCNLVHFKLKNASTRAILSIAYIHENSPKDLTSLLVKTHKNFSYQRGQAQ